MSSCLLRITNATRKSTSHMLPHQVVAMHRLRYSITTCPLQSGADIRVAQGLLGPVDVNTRIIYRHAKWLAGVPNLLGCLVALLPKPHHLTGDVARVK